MRRVMNTPVYATFVVLVLALGCAQQALQEAQNTQSSQATASGDRFRVDPFWPKELPNKWLLGQVIGMHVDSRDHIWVLHRPRSLSEGERGADAKPPTSECCVAAPAVLEFDQEGNIVQSWGGPGPGYEWPTDEHGIFVDYKDNVWIGGNGAKDGLVLKFSRDGKFLLQIGHEATTSGSNDLKVLGGPADIAVDPTANEVFVADGYRNRRVIVFDADTGAYKRHWGAYGKPPVDGELPPYNAKEASPIFGSTVHCVVISNEGLVYVCDRSNHRIQVFNKDGSFAKEGFAGRETGGASAWDVDFSRDANQSSLYNADGGNHMVWELRRDSLETVGTFGRRGRNAGQFESPHSLGVDSKGNIYVGETLAGRRIQRFLAPGQAASN